jgi:sulfoxide reductase heme-binding subunit YedZ
MAGVKYRGLSAESRPLRWVLFIAIVGLVIWFTGPEAMRTVAGWLGAEQESLPWFSSRILGFLGYYALAGSVIYGLLLSTGILDALTHRAVSFNLHQELSAIGIALVALHGAVLALDKFVAMTPVAIAVPFAAPYRPVWVGIGQLAFVLMVAIYASFYFRKQLGQRGWRILHYTTFLAFIGGTVHGLMAGTDTSAPWALWSYVGATALVVFLLGYRITLSVARSRAATSTFRKEAS